MSNKFFRPGDLVKYSRIEYYATDNGNIESNSDDKIALFLNFTKHTEEATSEIFIFSESDTTAVATHDLTLLSRNES